MICHHRSANLKGGGGKAFVFGFVHFGTKEGAGGGGGGGEESGRGQKEHFFVVTDKGTSEHHQGVWQKRETHQAKL